MQSRVFLLAIPLVCTSLLVHCSKTPPANVAATVNGRAITFEELDKQYEILFGQERENISVDERAARRLEVLRGLIDKEILLLRAEQAGLLAIDSDVDAKFAELKAPYTEEEFQRELEARKMSADELRAQLRREISIEKLLNKEITSYISITDQDVKESYEANKASFHLVEPQLHLARIMVTPHPDANVRNLSRDNAQNEEQARAKIKAIEARLKRGEDFAMVAQNYSEDPNTAANGGDLGFIPESSLEQASVEIRGAVMALQPGQVTGVMQSAEGYSILKLISREPAGQRELEDPRVQQTIRDTLRNRKDQLLKAAYYEVARNEAEVVNYFALHIAERKGAADQ